MNKSSNQSLLTHQLIRSVDRARRFNHASSYELLMSACSLLAHVSNILSKETTSGTWLDNQEQKILVLVEKTINNIFAARRQGLPAGHPSVQALLSTDQILDSTKHMLLNDEMTHHEGLQLVGELVSTLTYFQKPTIESLQEIKALETETLEHIQEKLTLALEAIQVQHGFIIRQ